MGEKTKALITLALGGLAVYFLLKAKEAQASEIKLELRKPASGLPLSYTPVVKTPEAPKGLIFDFERGKAGYRYNGGEATLDINWLLEKVPVLKQLKFNALPYQHANVYQ